MPPKRETRGTRRPREDQEENYIPGETATRGPQMARTNSANTNTSNVSQNTNISTTAAVLQPPLNVTTMGGPSTSNVMTTQPNYRGGISREMAIAQNAQMLTTETPEQREAREAAELQQIIQAQRATMEAQRQQLVNAQQATTVGNNVAAAASQQEASRLGIIAYGFQLWQTLALASRFDQFKAWTTKKIEEYYKQPRLIDLKNRENVIYNPSPALNRIRWQDRKGFATAERNYKTGVAQNTALIELFTMYNILKQRLSTLQNSVDPIDRANAISIQRQYAESYFVFIYLNQEHINAALETIKLLESSISVSSVVSKNNKLERTRSFVTDKDQIITTLDQNTIQSINTMYNLLDDQAITSVSPILGTNIDPISVLPTISDDNMLEAEDLYNNIVQKRNAAIGLGITYFQEKQIPIGPLAGLVVANIPSNNNVNIYTNSDIYESDLAFEKYKAQVQTSKIIPTPTNLSALRLAPQLPSNDETTTTTSNVMTNDNTTNNNGGNNNANVGGARRHRRDTRQRWFHRRTQKRKHRRTNAKRQSRRSRH